MKTRYDSQLRSITQIALRPLRSTTKRDSQPSRDILFRPVSYVFSLRGIPRTAINHTHERRRRMGHMLWTMARPKLCLGDPHNAVGPTNNFPVYLVFLACEIKIENKNF